VLGTDYEAATVRFDKAGVKSIYMHALTALPESPSAIFTPVDVLSDERTRNGAA
jgi:hypothetical protein